MKGNRPVAEENWPEVEAALSPIAAKYAPHQDLIEKYRSPSGST